MVLRGRCLCQAVQYELDEPFDAFVYCYCSRCRHATGTAHAANAVVPPGAFRWISGEDKLARYNLPTARGFATTFCTTCGSPMPHLTKSGRRVIVPAGSLIDEPSMKPTIHAHWASRAGWFEIDPDLPRVDEDAF